LLGAALILGAIRHEQLSDPPSDLVPDIMLMLYPIRHDFLTWAVLRERLRRPTAPGLVLLSLICARWDAGEQNGRTLFAEIRARG
jgi:hypothetical protein